MKKLRSQGFGTIETLLSIIAIALVVFVGYYVYHSNQVASQTYSTASNIAQSNPVKQSGIISTNKAGNTFITIKEWGVKAPYTGTSSLSYKITGDAAKDGSSVAQFSSVALHTAAPTCATGGGTIQRYKPDANASEGGLVDNFTAADRAAQSDKSTYAFVGGYYYFYAGAQSACGDSPTAQAAQQKTESDVKSIVPNLIAE